MTNTKPKTIALDGPAASGKTTIAKHLADRLGYLFFDTGVMYRAVTWLALDRGLDMSDEDQITGISETVNIDVRPQSVDDGRDYDVLADGLDVTWKIRLPSVDANVSVVSAYPGVRAALSAQQRRIGLRGDVVLVGRDIGTVVLPEAELKIYLDASPEERARRRFLERIARGERVDLKSILDAMVRRDEIDSNREVAPLKAADDAVIIDSDNLSIEQVLDAVMELIPARDGEQDFD